MSLRATVIAASSIVGAVVAIWGAGFSVVSWADERYENKKDSERQFSAVKEEIVSSRRAFLADKVYELELKKHPTQDEKALKERYKDQIKEIDSKRERQ